MIIPNNIRPVLLFPIITIFSTILFLFIIIVMPMHEATSIKWNLGCTIAVARLFRRVSM